MLTKLYIVRHTQTTGNVEKRLTGRDDYEVTYEGNKFIRALTQRLENINFDKVYSSTSGRAVKTVELLAEKNNLDIIQSDELCEMYFGIYDGMKWEDVNSINPLIHENHVKTNEIMGIENQESSEVVANRMYDYIRKICIENLNKTILISSHGVSIEAFLRKITGEPFGNKREEYSQKNTSLNIVQYDSKIDCFEVLLLNDYSHLIQKDKESKNDNGR